MYEVFRSEMHEFRDAYVLLELGKISGSHYMIKNLNGKNEMI